jgi:hypothetical protein
MHKANYQCVCLHTNTLRARCLFVASHHNLGLLAVQQPFAYLSLIRTFRLLCMPMHLHPDPSSGGRERD